MGINAVYGMDENKVKRRGKFFNTIDFEVNESLSNQNHVERNGIVGSFTIGNSRFDLTNAEVRAIQETMENAQEVINKKFKMGLLVK